MSPLSPWRVRSTMRPCNGLCRPERRGEGRRGLIAANDRLERDGIAASGYASVGNTAEEILRTADVFQAELIVLGARSLGEAGAAGPPSVARLGYRSREEGGDAPGSRDGSNPLVSAPAARGRARWRSE
jgi:hypothetical protein